MASTKGALSISPSVPPSSILQSDWRSDVDKVGDGPTNYANIGFLVAVVRRSSGNTFNPVLNGVREVWDDLNCSAQIIPTTLLLDNVLIHFTGGNLENVNPPGHSLQKKSEALTLLSRARVIFRYLS